MKWRKIKRNEHYYTTGESMLEMKSCLPIVLYDEIDNIYDIATKDEDICDITGYNFSHYLPIKFIDMKEETTIKEIKEAKAELEQNLAKLVNDFEQKYDIEVYSVGFDSTEHLDELGNYSIRDIRANVELNLKI